jgi:drug/metabolite transporter (DMT)-like permease
LVGTVIGVERVESVGWLGIGLSLVGIFLIISGSDRLAVFPFGGSSLRGDVLILAGTLCWSLYTLLVRSMTRRYSAVSVTSFTTAMGTIPLVLVGIPTVAEPIISATLVPAATENHWTRGPFRRPWTPATKTEEARSFCRRAPICRAPFA